jgi:predicted dehydrogenase
MQTIRYGFIGAGQVAHGSGASVNKHPYARVTAIQDLNAERLSALAEKLEVSKTYHTAQELYADPDIDAVYIAVPNRFHAPLAKAALEAGKHVILEKPFALSAAEAEEVLEAARKAGKVFTVGMNQRFPEAHQKMRALVKAGALGEIYHAKTTWHRRSGIPKLGTWFGSKELAGSGCLFDIGVHALDLCMYCIDNFEPVSVSGSTYTKFGNRGLGEGGWGHSERNDILFDVEDFATAMIRFANGATVSLDVAWACHMETGNARDVLIYGTEAGGSAVGGKLFRRNPEIAEYEVVTELDAKPEFPECDRFANFTNHILGTEVLCVTPQQALTVQKVLDAIALSSATNREVSL